MLVKNKIIVGLLSLGFILAPAMEASAATINEGQAVLESQQSRATGWKQVNGIWYYYKNDVLVKGWLELDGVWYLLDSNNGSMKTGWQQVSGVWYLLDNTYGYMKTGWQQVDGKWYYLDNSSGAMKTGWQVIDGKSYYFWTSEGSMASDTFVDGYYVAKDGSWVSKQDSIGEYAKKFLGVPYVWGADGPYSFDCSGFTKYVYKNILGIDITRVTTSQVNVGTAVSKSNLKKGDLVFFNNTYNGANPTHVGIYMGDGTFIHCGDNGVGYSNLNSGYWSDHYSTARRVG